MRVYGKTRKQILILHFLFLFFKQIYFNKMAQQMEIDFNVPKFLSEERQKAPAHLQQYFTTFEDLYERK